MSSLWTVMQYINFANKVNETLPAIATSDNNKIQNKQSSKTIHVSNASSKKKLQKRKSFNSFSIIKNNIKPVHSFSRYKKLKDQQSQKTLQFGSLNAIKSLFNQQSGIHNTQVQKNSFKLTADKIRFKKIVAMQDRLEPNLNKLVKQQFEIIIKLYTKKTKQSKPFRYKRRVAHRFETAEEEQNYLYEIDKQQIYKRIKSFHRSQRHLALHSFSIRLLHHHLYAELCLQLGHMEDALTTLCFCEYYSRKIDLDQYVIPCVCMQSQILQSQLKYDQSINLMKTALEFSIVKKYKDLQFRILQRISLIYYYRGNSYMSRYYKNLSENGIPQNQLEIYIKQYSKLDQLKALQSRIFKTPFQNNGKTKHNRLHQHDISRDLIHDHEKMMDQQHENIKIMLKHNSTSKAGMRIASLIRQNRKKTQVKVISQQKDQKMDLLPRYINFQYPIQHCTQIMKSHLSKNRLINQNMKSINFNKSYMLMRSLYNRLCVGSSNQVVQKQNISSVNVRG